MVIGFGVSAECQSTSCHWFLCFGTRPRHQTRAPWLGPPILKKGKSNILHNLYFHTFSYEGTIEHNASAYWQDNEWPLNKTVPVVSRIFDVSSSTGLGIEGCRTCWKDELGNHTLGMKAQNMHLLRVLGAKKQAL